MRHDNWQLRQSFLGQSAPDNSEAGVSAASNGVWWVACGNNSYSYRNRELCAGDPGRNEIRTQQNCVGRQEDVCVTAKPPKVRIAERLIRGNQSKDEDQRRADNRLQMPAYFCEGVTGNPFSAVLTATRSAMISVERLSRDGFQIPVPRHWYGCEQSGMRICGSRSQSILSLSLKPCMSFFNFGAARPL